MWVVVGSSTWNQFMILPEIGPSGPMAWGACIPIRPGVGGTSACQPHQATV